MNKWPPHGDEVLELKWDDVGVRRVDLARELGVSVESLYYHAVKLGLETSGHDLSRFRSSAADSSQRLLDALRANHAPSEVVTVPLTHR